MSLKSGFLAKPLSAFAIYAALRSVRFTYLMKHHRKHSLSPEF